MDITTKELIDIIEKQDSWATDEFAELLKRADIDPTADPYVVDGEPMVEPETIFEIAKVKLGF